MYSRRSSKIFRSLKKARKCFMPRKEKYDLSTSEDKSDSQKQQPYIIHVEEKRRETGKQNNSSLLLDNRPGKRFIVSYEYLVWFVFLTTTGLCLLDHFVRNGDVMFGRSGKHPKRIWGTNVGETLTNIVWAVTARVIITSQNMMFYTTLWCFPNMICEIAPRWVNVNGIRDVHLKMHRLIGIFLIAIPSVAHVLVIFVPPLIDGVPLKYYPPSSFNYSKFSDHLNWTEPWDPAAVSGWSFNDPKGVHLTSDEVYRLLLMIVLFCFLFPLSRSEYLNNRSYSTAIALHAFAGVWYAIDNIRKITHSLAHIFNLPMLIIWCIDRLFSIVLYRRNKGHVVYKEVIGNGRYTIIYIKLEKKPEVGVGDVYYFHQSHKLFRDIIPQRAHPFTVFSNHGKDSSWDIGLVMTVMEDHQQWTLPWTRWMGGKEQVRPFHTWGPYRSSVGRLHEQLLLPSNSGSSPHYLLLASGSGFGYILDVLSILAHKANTSKNCQSKIKPTVEIHYSVRSWAVYVFFRDYVNELLKKIQEKNTALVKFNCYVTDGGEKLNSNHQGQENHVQLFFHRFNFEEVLRNADKNTAVSFVGRPSLADTIDKSCQKNGLTLIKDNTNGQRGTGDGQLLKRYLKISCWAIAIIVVACFIAHLFIDVQKIKTLVQNKAKNKTRF